jgi:hypothetical protein
VICIAQNYDFSGAPHCVLPIEWNSNVTPWQMTIFDSNFPNQRRIITIDPAANCFRYDGSSDGSRIYTGDAWSGGRFHFMPWTVLNHQQRTPVWDAILLLLGGVLLIFGDSTEVSGLVDEKGNSLESSTATNREALKGKLVRVPGVSGGGPIKGGFYVGRQDRSAFMFNATAVSMINRLQPVLSASAVAPVSRGGMVRGNLSNPPAVRLPVASDAPANAIAGAAVMDLIRNNGIGFIRPNEPTDLDTIRSTLRGKANGKLSSYYKRGLVGVQVEGDVQVGEQISLAYERMGGRENELRIRSDRQRSYSVSFNHKIGAGRDFMKININGVPLSAGQQTILNFQPGTRVINVLAANAPADVRITVDGSINGEKIRSVFGTQLQGGSRLVLPDLSDPGRLKLEAIDNILGPGRAHRIINRQ